ncbi:hypothetical protein [Microbispora bryophytorum]|uniref:hypothetical protein n=1 Tax=Microbispora bryophytorum TaxID=1460882 RepID=UPI0034078688
MPPAASAFSHRGKPRPHAGAIPEDRYVVDARRLAAALGDARPAPRESPWFGYSALDPAHLAAYDGVVFVRDVTRS